MLAPLTALGVILGCVAVSVGDDAPSPGHLGSMSVALSVALRDSRACAAMSAPLWWLLQTMIPYSGLKRYWRFPGSFARVAPWRIRQDKTWRFVCLPCARFSRRLFSLLNPRLSVQIRVQIFPSFAVKPPSDSLAFYLRRTRV
jgi:hypothetical protein